jgi:sugar-specific transcriptional regulator TrmB
MEEELKLLGLNDVDIKVYLTLLKLGQSSAAQIAEKAEVNRASIYDVLERLEKEGLVSHIIKDFIKLFSAAEPKTIVQSLEYKKKKISDILPELEKVKGSSTGVSRTEIFTGQKGMQTILNTILEEKEIFVMGASRKTREVMPFFMEKWMKERAKRKIKVKILYNDTEEVRKSVKKSREYLGVNQGWDYRFLHIDYSSPIMTVIFGNKVMLGIWKKDYPSAILIENKEIAETYKQYVLSLWKIAKK